MPLFGRRSRSVPVARTTTPLSNSPAMLAASQAFLGSQAPPTKLATGAAATALRTMSPTSTPVAQVQTKRIMERQSSVGPVAGAQRGRPRGSNLQRRSSSSSMTERTFRQESPGRPSTSSGVPASGPTEPPVPPIPVDLTDVPPIPKKSHRRPASIDELPIKKGAAARQPPNRTSVAAAPPVDPAFAAAKRVTSAQLPAQLDRTDSNSSHNFSYPGRARPNSPPPQKSRFDAPSHEPAINPVATKPISATGVHNIQHDLAETAEKPVKKRLRPTLAEGSHLRTGTMGSKPTVTPLAPGPPAREENSPQESDRGINNAKLTGQASHFPPSPVSPTDSKGSDSDSERTRMKRVQRASGQLTKQPSVVREDWEGEQQGFESSPIEHRPPPIKRQAPPEANVSRKIETTANPASPPQEAPETVTSLAAPQPRKPSLSPSRSTRFSSRLSADMTEGQKHEPPPRSLSPRKSALKNSPQISPVDAGRPRDPSLSPSEGTDISAEGGPRRKKTAHVKFDTHPAVVGIAADSGSPVSPQLVSPQNQKDKKWFGIRKAQNRVILFEDSDDDDDAMKPRPKLPTFGSVRLGRKNDVQDSPTQHVPSPPSSSSSSISADTGPTTMDTSISSDHNVGGLLAREAEQKKLDLRTPVPPVVTSVEGTGLHSDTESVSSQDEPITTTPSTTSQPIVHSQIASTNQTAEALGTTKEVEDQPVVPGIAVQPATPRMEEELKHQDQWSVDLPGGFPSAGQDIPERETAALTQPTTSDAPHSDEPADMHQDGMLSIQEEDTDKDSIYSDAAENLPDADGDGFGSINAIVQSPFAPSPGARSTPPESPAVTMPQRNAERESGSSASDWTAAGARWKDNKESAQRASLQPAATFVDEDEPKPTTTAARKAIGIADEPMKLVSPASTVSSIVTSAQSPTPTGPAKTSRTSAQHEFRKSMRTEPQGAPAHTLRGNARGGTDVPRPMRSSMRESTAPIYTSAPATVVPAAEPRGALQKTNLRASAPPPRHILPPVDNDSDSESSFKRRRRSRANDGGKYTMRRSMRFGSGSEAQLVGSGAVRSLSSVERRPFSPVGGQSTMRSTLRGSRDDVPTLRGNLGRDTRSSSLFGRNKAKSPASPMKGGLTGPKSHFAADSDDGGDTRPGVFRSRFADSSDEEGDLRPVRGIPRRDRDDDSTDLEDSSDDEARSKKTAGPKKESPFAVSASLQVPGRLISPTSPEGKKKRGLFGRLRKNKDDSARPMRAEPAPALNGTQKNGKTRNAESATLGFTSDAQKEALIEQTRKKLETARETAASLPPERRMSTTGKLHRRTTPSRVVSDSWPLPPKIPDDDQTVDRPVTSDGTGASRPPLGDRPTSSGTAETSPTAEVYGRSGKKKRFPLLRKAFGLKD